MSAAQIPDNQRNGYLETIGRVSGLPRETEIWYTVADDKILLLSGYHNNKDWVKNFLKEPRVRFRIGDEWFSGRARLLDGDSELEGRARHQLMQKYHGTSDLNEWARTGTIVAIDVD